MCILYVVVLPWLMFHGSSLDKVLDSGVNKFLTNFQLLEEFENSPGDLPTLCNSITATWFSYYSHSILNTYNWQLYTFPAHSAMSHASRYRSGIQFLVCKGGSTPTLKSWESIYGKSRYSLVVQIPAIFNTVELSRLIIWLCEWVGPV